MRTFEELKDKTVSEMVALYEDEFGEEAPSRFLWGDEFDTALMTALMTGEPMYEDPEEEDEGEPVSKVVY